MDLLGAVTPASQQDKTMLLYLIARYQVHTLVERYVCARYVVYEGGEVRSLAVPSSTPAATCSAQVASFAAEHVTNTRFSREPERVAMHVRLRFRLMTRKPRTEADKSGIAGEPGSS